MDSYIVARFATQQKYSCNRHGKFAFPAHLLSGSPSCWLHVCRSVLQLCFSLNMSTAHVSAAPCNQRHSATQHRRSCSSWAIQPRTLCLQRLLQLSTWPHAAKNCHCPSQHQQQQHGAIFSSRLAIASHTPANQGLTPCPPEPVLLAASSRQQQAAVEAAQNRQQAANSSPGAKAGR